MPKQSPSVQDQVSDRELFTFRILNARREKVFMAFSNPDHLMQWWGPKGFTNTFYEFDLRPGGSWRFIMHGPDGTNFQNESVFVDVVPPERVIFKHISHPKFEMTITFEEQNGKTRIGWHQVFETADERQRIAKFAIEANQQNLDRLEKQLIKLT
jgi:uncharacterized protein YndB with AHSA1/START domain